MRGGRENQFVGRVRHFVRGGSERRSNAEDHGREGDVRVHGGAVGEERIRARRIRRDKGDLYGREHAGCGRQTADRCGGRGLGRVRED
jgi:hypothetical protein